MLPWIDEARRVELYGRSLAHCRLRFPSAPVADIERIDPEKIAAYPSAKGSAGRLRTDDRTVVIVHL